VRGCVPSGAPKRSISAGVKVSLCVMSQNDNPPPGNDPPATEK